MSINVGTTIYNHLGDLRTLRARQHRALCERLGSRVYITERGVVFVDGVDVTGCVEDDAASLESDECAEDIVFRCIYAAGGNPFAVGALRSDAAAPRCYGA